MSENLNEDLQKFEELERLLEDGAEVKSDEVEAEETDEETDESPDSLPREDTHKDSRLQSSGCEQR